MEGVGVAVVSGGGDHGGVVGAEDEWWVAQGHSQALAQAFAEAGVGGDASGDEHFPRPELGSSGCGFLYQGVHNGSLERGSEVGYGGRVGAGDAWVWLGAGA